MGENREALQTPTHDGVGRSKKAKSRNFDMHVSGESDGLIVPTKRANKVDATALAAESAEGRRATKGNAPQAHSRRTQSRGCESQGLWRVRQAARRDRRTQFTALLHHVTPEFLRASYWELNQQAVPGIDGETWVEYRKPRVAYRRSSRAGATRDLPSEAVQAGMDTKSWWTTTVGDSCKSRMREFFTYGSVRGAARKGGPYRD